MRNLNKYKHVYYNKNNNLLSQYSCLNNLKRPHSYFVNVIVSYSFYCVLLKLYICIYLYNLWLVDSHLVNASRAGDSHDGILVYNWYQTYTYLITCRYKPRVYVLVFKIISYITISGMCYSYWFTIFKTGP